MSANLDKSDATMNRLNWIANRKLASFIWAFLVLVPVSWLLVRGFVLDWLPLIMGIGPVLAGLWLYATIQVRARRRRKDSPLEAKFQRQSAIEWLIKSLIVGLIVGFGAALAIALNGNNLFGYNAIKGFGVTWLAFITYSVIGLTPVVAYTYTVHRLLTQRKLWVTIALGIVSLLAPWLWASQLAYTINPG